MELKHLVERSRAGDVEAFEQLYNSLRILTVHAWFSSISLERIPSPFNSGGRIPTTSHMDLPTLLCTCR